MWEPEERQNLSGVRPLDLNDLGNGNRREGPRRQRPAWAPTTCRAGRRSHPLMIRRGWGRGAVSGGSWPCGECFSGSLWHDPEGPAGTHPGDSATAPECIEPSGIVGTFWAHDVRKRSPTSVSGCRLSLLVRGCFAALPHVGDWGTVALPRWGSRVRIPSSAPQRGPLTWDNVEAPGTGASFLGGYSHESPTKSCRGRVNGGATHRLRVGCGTVRGAGGLAPQCQRIG